MFQEADIVDEALIKGIYCKTIRFYKGNTSTIIRQCHIEKYDDPTDAICQLNKYEQKLYPIYDRDNAKVYINVTCGRCNTDACNTSISTGTYFTTAPLIVIISGVLWLAIFSFERQPV